jgi:hypothetical protein
MAQKWTAEELEVIREFVNDPDVDDMTREIRNLIKGRIPELNDNEPPKKMLN